MTPSRIRIRGANRGTLFRKRGARKRVTQYLRSKSAMTPSRTLGILLECHPRGNSILQRSRCRSLSLWIASRNVIEIKGDSPAAKTYAGKTHAGKTSVAIVVSTFRIRNWPQFHSNQKRRFRGLGKIRSSNEVAFSTPCCKLAPTPLFARPAFMTARERHRMQLLPNTEHDPRQLASAIF